MSDVIKSLRRYDFPDVLRNALHQLEKILLNKFDTMPPPELSDQIVEEFIFQQPIGRKGIQKRRLTAMQELQIAEAMLQYFSQKSNLVLQQHMFTTLFATSDRHKMELLYKLVSMAVGIGSSNVLNMAAVWMQTKGCGSDVVCSLCKRLVEDYFSLMPSTGTSPIHKLPVLSAHFTCNFITALTCIYQPLGCKSGPCIPACLLEELSCWLSDDPRLCLAPLSSTQGPLLGAHRTTLWTSPTKSNTQTPTPGLVRWCVKAPLYHEAYTREVNNKVKATVGQSAPETHLKQLWAKLHLAVLETMLHLRLVPDASQLELLTLVDMNRAVRDVQELYGKLKDSATLKSDSNLQVAVDRLVQILQISLSTGAFRCSLADLRNILQALPPSPLIGMLEAQHLSTAPPAMHNAPM